MIKLYLDSNIADWAYVIFKADWGEKIRIKDTKLPIKKKIEQYVCLRYLMDLDDEWDIIFGTSNMMKILSRKKNLILMLNKEGKKQS